MKKRTGALLAAAALCLAACGAPAPAEETPGAGTYTCVRAESRGRELDLEELSPGGIVLELRSGGEGRLLSGGEEGRIQWTLEGETLLLQTGEGSSQGTLADGLITLDLLGSGTVLTLAAEGVEPETEQLPEQWLGGWYGRWTVTETTGAWAELRGRSYDCCGVTEQAETGALRLTVWDEDGSREEPLAAAALLPQGDQARVQQGVFLGAELAAEDWTVRCEDGPARTLRLSGVCRGAEGTLRCEMLLRPWGALWDDVREEQLPYYYESWYLPLAEAGAELPDRLEPPA